MLLLFSLACTEAIWYPHAPSGVPPVGDDTGADTSGGDSLPCSPSTATPAADLAVSNTGNVPLSLYWRDNTCTESWYAEILPGDTYSQPTYEGHVWVARTLEGAYINHVITPTGSSTWEVAP